MSVFRLQSVALCAALDTQVASAACLIDALYD
jgi:hypothetical protein